MRLRLVRALLASVAPLWVPVAGAGETAPTFVHEVIEVPRSRSGDEVERPPIAVGVWAPPFVAEEESPVERLPLFFFSHGYGGSGGSYTYLTERLAAAGWIVVAPDHDDPVSVVRLREEDETDRTLELLRSVRDLIREEFDFDRHRGRLDETEAVLDAILADERYGPRIDPDRIAAGGHSFGGYTTLGLAGAIEGRRDDRIGAVALLSPGLWMFDADDFARVEVPTLYLLGENELADERRPGTKLDLSRTAYAAFPEPKLLYALEDGRHLSFNDRSRTAFGRRKRRAEAELDAIGRLVLAFLEEHVGGRGQPDAARTARETGRFLELAPKPAPEGVVEGAESGG
ncbi:MAG: alpha/beta hydrolase family protein [Planctomycetota bacterium JB042]